MKSVTKRLLETFLIHYVVIFEEYKYIYIEL